MNPNTQPLQAQHLAATITPHMASQTAGERARLRITEEMNRLDLSQRDIAGLLGWSQSRVSKLLTGQTILGVDDLESLCFAVNLSLTEVVRDRGFEFCAELTPTELRILERLRALGPSVVDSLLQILEPQKRPPLESRGSAKKPLLGRPRLR